MAAAEQSNVTVKYNRVNRREVKYTIDSTKKHRCIFLESYARKQLKVALCVTLGNVAIGYTMGWSAPVIPRLMDPLQTPLPHQITDLETYWITSSLAIGAIIGAIIIGNLSNYIGRKTCLLIGSCCNLVGFSLLASTGTLLILYAGRFFVGLSVGTIPLLNFVYIGEIASPNIRGTLSTLTGILYTIGCLVVYSLAPYISLPAVGYVGVGISGIHTLALCCVPESPMYYFIKGKVEKANVTLRNLGRREDINEEGSKVTKLLPRGSNELKAAVPMKNLRSLIFEKKNRSAFLITAPFFILQNAGGVIAVVAYATTIFKNAQSSVDPNIATVILALTELCGVLLTPLFIERCGRRVLLLISTGGCCLCMGILGTYFYCEIMHYTFISSVRWAPLILLMLCLFSYNTGLSTVPDTLTGEMYSPHLRSTASSISLTLGLCVAFITSINFVNIVAHLGNYGVFWMYSFINAIGFIFTVFVVPETKGMTLIEIRDMLER